MKKAKLVTSSGTSISGVITSEGFRLVYFRSNWDQKEIELRFRRLANGEWGWADRRGRRYSIKAEGKLPEW